MSGFETRHFFTFTVIVRRDLRIRYAEKLRLVAALQLGFVRMSGVTLTSLALVVGSVVAISIAVPFCSIRAQAPGITELRWV